MKKMLTKIGTEQLCDQSGNLFQQNFNEIARQVSSLFVLGFQVCIVTSGAVTAGRDKMLNRKEDTSTWVAKDFAGVGMPIIMGMWIAAFAKFDVIASQVLVTHGDLSRRSSRASVSSSVTNYFNSGLVTILNENDVISATEIFLWSKRISENDQLARKLCELVKPDIVTFVTSVGGVFDKNPKNHLDAKMYQELDIRHLPAEVLASEGKSACGKGGMKNKVVQAAMCCNGDRRVGIISIGQNAIYRFAIGESVGTLLGRENMKYE